MKKIQKRVSLPWRTLAKIETLSASLLLATGLITIGMTANTNRAAASEQPMTDGVYLYGQSPEPESIGSEYLVFEVNQGKVIGGFYMPRSSFDCFYGKVDPEQLALTVIDSYEQTPHAYSVALQSQGSVASAGNGATTPVGLEGYHRLDDLSDTDRQILATCKADHQ